MVERVVAVIDDEPLFASEVRQRTQPFIVRIREQNDGKPKPKEEAQALQAMLERMIEERLIARHAAEKLIAVDSKQVDEALERIAKLGNKTVEALLDEVLESTGLDAAAYRAEIRRQILEGKVLLVEAGTPPTDPNARAVFLANKKRDLLRRLHAQHAVEVRARFQ